VHPLYRLVEQAGADDGVGIGRRLPGRPGFIFASRDPHLAQRSGKGLVIALANGEQSEPAAGSQQARRLAELDLRVDPVECRGRDHQVEGTVGRGEVLKRANLERDR
jgi:hypothetical protein